MWLLAKKSVGKIHFLGFTWSSPTCACLCRRGLFRGRLVIHSGGIASGFNNSTEGDSYDTDGVSLFHVKGTQPENTYGVQVASASLFFCFG